MSTKTQTRFLHARTVLKQQFTSGNTVGPVSEFATSSELAYTRTRTGGSQPQWRSIIKSGGNATTDFSASDVQVTGTTPLVWSASYPSVPTDPDGYWEYYEGIDSFMLSPPFHIFGYDQVSADNDALSHTLSRLSAQQHDFQGLVALGELKETIALLRHPFRAADKLYQSYLRDLKKSKSFEELNRRRRRVEKEKFLETAAALHLEVAFGMRPLISDVKDLLKSIVHLVYDRPPRQVIRGSGSSVVSESTQSSGAVGNLGVVKTTTVTRTSYGVTYTAYIDNSHMASIGSVEAAQKSLGFDLESFAPSLYNLIPFSFLVDYFSNLGNIIEAGSTSQTSVKFVRRTVRLETTRSVLKQPTPGPLFLSRPRTQQLEAQAGLVLITRKDVARTSLPSVPIPSLEIHLPGKPTQWANMLALLGSNSRFTSHLRF